MQKLDQLNHLLSRLIIQLLFRRAENMFQYWQQFRRKTQDGRFTFGICCSVSALWNLR